MSSEDRRLGTRVNLTLSDELIRVLDRMGAVTGSGRATIIRELMEEMGPQLAQMATALEHAQRGSVDAALKHIGQTVSNAVSQSEQLQLDIKKTRRKLARKKQQ